MLDVAVILLNDNHASTAIGPLEVFYSAGLLWNRLKGEAVAPGLRVTIASVDGEPVTGAEAALEDGHALLQAEGPEFHVWRIHG